MGKFKLLTTISYAKRQNYTINMSNKVTKLIFTIIKYFDNYNYYYIIK